MSTKRNGATLLLSFVLLASAAGLSGCSEDSTSSPNGTSPFSPTTNPDSGSPSNPVADGGTIVTADGGGCPNKPAGCFCGTPTTQAQFLNRCTTSAALPVNGTVKPATTADIP